MVDLHQEFKNSRFFHEARIDRRSVDVLSGLAAGVAADGKINQQEAEFLQGWIAGNLVHLEDPVVNLLYRRLSGMLSDGVLADDESVELLGMLHCFTGLTASKPTANADLFVRPNSLPLCQPAPEIQWNGKVFIFTGVMAYGPRKACEALVLERCGLIGSSVSKKISYLVIGSISNDQWLHSSYGTKIKKAVELREAGVSLAIVSEDHWQKAMF